MQSCQCVEFPAVFRLGNTYSNA